MTRPPAEHSIVVRRTFVAAVAAGLLWCAQGPIWVLAPKVQATVPPYQVTHRALFLAVWLSVDAAVLFSALALRGLASIGVGNTGRTGRVTTRIAALAAALAGVATAATATAGLGIAEDQALAVLPLALDLGGFTLLVAVILVAVRPNTLRRVLPRRSRFLPAVLAGLTFLTLVAVASSGTHATIGLILAVVTVDLSGAAWMALGWMVQRAPAHRSRQRERGIRAAAADRPGGSGQRPTPRR